MQVDKALESQSKCYYYDQQIAYTILQRQYLWIEQDEAILFFKWLRYCELKKKEKRLDKRIDLYYNLSDKYHKQYFDIMWNYLGESNG